MPLLNLGILAHVDAGKTSLTERLLYDAGVVDSLGSVDAGTTRTDSLELERRRGITIRAAVTSFPLPGVTVTLIDTPGHPDFVAEVERALSVLDGAILVVSAVHGVQAQTHVLMRTLRRLRIPTLIFINKADRRGARPDAVRAEIASRLGVPVVAMPTDPHLADVLAMNDDTLLAELVDGTGTPDLGKALAEQSRAGLVHPVFVGSAVTGAGLDALRRGITELLPYAPQEASGPLSARVFAIQRGPRGDRIAYARILSGTLHLRDRFAQGRVTGLRVHDTPVSAAPAGHIAVIAGLAGARIGDTLGTGVSPEQRFFAPPTLQSVVVPADPARAGAVYAALSRLAEQDPLIGLRPDPLAVTLYGEVQKEVIADTLATGYGLSVTFEKARTLYAERLTGTGEHTEVIAATTNPYLATVGLRAEPGTGTTFRLAVEPGAMPAAFFTAVEQSVHDTLRTGGPHGWPVLDCTVTMTRCGYLARQSHAHGTFDKSMSSTAGDFRALTRLVLTEALRQAGTRECEPVHRLTLTLPADTLTTVLPVLGALRGIPLDTVIRAGHAHVQAELPAAHVHDLRQRLPALTHGEGVLDAVFDRYA